ncbi:AraC family transcriptional regulator [Bacillus sp. CGMCC 1.16541]|uniref:AraC family transcriptional regulator n=1 Tax=Bacillus sp. CGMCC 1.16541 TaxID=2185143 RepID=UPI001EF73CC9|nr:AraC family transcriptional regulator [Bacillus sp. CGMCC 1.16541]
MGGLHSFHSTSVSCLTIRAGKTQWINDDEKQLMLLYIASGDGQLSTEQERIPLVEGKCYWVTKSSMLVASANLLTVYTMSWIEDKLTNNWLGELQKIPLASQSPARVIPLYEDLLLLQNKPSFSEKCRFQATVWNVMSALTDVTEVDNMEEAVSFIRQNLSQPYSVTELAARAGMTPTSFSRAFRKKVGMSPKEFLNEERIKVAKELMIQKKGMTTKDIAHHVGVQDEFYFSRLFKKKEGVPPTIYMKRADERVAVISQMFLQDHLLSLGIQPVAAPAYPSLFPLTNGVPSYLSKQLEGTFLLNAEQGIEKYEVLHTMPDHIIKTPLHHKEQSILWGRDSNVHAIDVQETWDGYLQQLSVLFNKECHVETVMEEIRMIENQVKNQICSTIKTGKWAVLWIRSDEIRLYGYSGHACIDLLFTRLEFEPHPSLPKEQYQIVEVEDLVLLNPDKVLILWSHESDVLKVSSSPQWSFIKAVQTGNVYCPNSIEWDPWGPIGRKHMLQSLVSFFEGSA